MQAKKILVWLPLIFFGVSILWCAGMVAAGDWATKFLAAIYPIHFICLLASFVFSIFVLVRIEKTSRTNATVMILGFALLILELLGIYVSLTAVEL